MACCILIIGFILTEISYDKYHEKANRIYRLISNLTLGDTPNMIATTNAPPALAMRDEYPEVLQAARILPMKRVSVKQEDKEFYEDRIFYADAEIFDIFTFPLSNGNPETALDRAYSVVISKNMAKKYFGDMDPMGKIIRINDEYDYTITGIVKNVPSNSHFIFDMLLSFETLLTQNRQRIETWASSFIYHSYLLLEKNSNPKEVEKKLPALVDKHIGDTFKSFGASVKYFLQPVTSIHLHSKLRHEIAAHSDIKYVYIFSFVALFVLLIACFNFMNLTTARSASRANEVGMRKVLGADRKRLIIQFLGESLVYSFFSLIVALVLVKLALPVFRSLSDRALIINFTEIPWLVSGFFFLAIIVGLFAGIYPAFFLASFQPVKVLKGNLKSGSANSLFRKVLVVSQFAISIALIICTGIVFKQLQYIQNKNLGFDKEHILVVPIADNNIRQSVSEIKEELAKNPAILSVAASSHVPGLRPSGGSYQPEGFPEGQTVMMDGMSIDHDYVPTLGMEIVAGRNFSLQHVSDPQSSILINESAVKEIGWEYPIGKTIRFPRQTEGKTVVGVVKNFHFKSPHENIRPIYISNGSQRRPYRMICIKIRSGGIPNTIAYLKDKWREFDPNRSLDYFFLDSTYDKQYRAEKKLSQVFTTFTLFAIFIACLGLYGMSSFTTQQRTKEIGIRKVLGATIPGILFYLSREFVWTVLISFIVAVPIAYYTMNRWLQDFAFRIEIGLSVFLTAGGLAVLVALATVSYQSIRAAKTNPVHTLKYE